MAGSVLLLLGAWLVNSLHVDDRPTLAETVETLTPPPDAEPKPKEVDMAVDRVVNGRVGVDLPVTRERHAERGQPHAV